MFRGGSEEEMEELEGVPEVAEDSAVLAEGVPAAVVPAEIGKNIAKIKIIC